VIRSVLLLLFVAGCAGCPARGAAPSPSSSAPAAGKPSPAVVTVPDGMTPCAVYCAHLLALVPDGGCPGAKPSPEGKTCLDRCEATQNGIARYDLACRIAAPSCAAVDACP